ncbi:hypothetical protein [Microtetraspora niveoalba]|uniref:hypothetical protein n=1 Tax=Microtetraspora niveoalba TaxID=46175 RepID=UPI0008358D2E|nr:hypothetical protein [Microtetraspora niveoalba]
MRKRTHDPAANVVAFAPVPQSQQPEPPPLRGAELRRPPSDHSVRARQPARGVRLVPRRRGY